MISLHYMLHVSKSFSSQSTRNKTWPLHYHGGSECLQSWDTFFFPLGLACLELGKRVNTTDNSNCTQLAFFDVISEKVARPLHPADRSTHEGGHGQRGLRPVYSPRKLIKYSSSTTFRAVFLWLGRRILTCENGFTRMTTGGREKKRQSHVKASVKFRP